MTTPTKTPWQFAITLDITAPFNTAASEPGIWGLDSPLLRDHLGRVCLPGTLVQGKLEEQLRNWDTGLFDQLVSLRGHSAEEGGDNKPSRKRLVFTDLALEKINGAPATQATRHLHRIAVDKDTGSVEKGALLVQETPAVAGAKLTFTGHAHAFVADEAQAQTLATQLQTLLRAVTEFGADGSIGFGQPERVTVRYAPCATNAAITLPPTTRSIHFALCMNRPLVVTDAPGSANSFESTETVAGNVLKGVFADTCTALGLEAPACLEHIVFRHAYCTPQNSDPQTSRPHAIPASLAECKNGADEVLVDLSEQPTPVLLQSENGIQAPTFATDWKPNDKRQKKLDTVFHWSHPQRLLRVRTAIAHDTRTAAEGQLFAWEMLAHEAPATEPGSPPTPWLWHTGIDLSSSKIGDAERQQALHTIQTVLQHGLYFLGKTKAIATVQQVHTGPEQADSDAATRLEAGQTLYLCLQTPALLTKMDSIRPGADAATLLQAYRQTFRQHSEHSLELSHFYARQTLRGGAYQQHRFQGQSYRPWLLTQPGAVFAFNVIDAAKAQAALQTWLSQGLPPAEGWSTDWSKNPYLPANGFGEVSLYDPGQSPFAPATSGIDCIPVPLPLTTHA